MPSSVSGMSSVSGGVSTDTCTSDPTSLISSDMELAAENPVAGVEGEGHRIEKIKAALGLCPKCLTLVESFRVLCLQLMFYVLALTVFIQ